MSALKISITKLKIQKELLTVRLRKISAILLATAVLFGATSAFGDEYKTKLTLTVAHALTSDEAYTLTVPGDLTLSGSGWNSIGNVNVKHGDSATTQFNPDKKVVVTASSQNGGLTNTSDSTKKISYTFKNAETETGNGSSTLAIDFSASEINTSGGTDKSFGIVVSDTSSAYNGTYEDYITYTAEVKSNTTTTTTVTWNADDITDQGSVTSFTKGGVTITAGSIDFDHKDFADGGTFTTTLGNFTKIEVSASSNPSGTGWSGGTWTGTASNSVSFTGNIMGAGEGLTLVFTIAQ